MALLGAVLLACSAGGGRGGDPRATIDRNAWQLPDAELGTQRLFRARIETPEARGRFRLLLRLIDREHFQLRATHPLFNRRLWSLEVKGDTALLVDYHQKKVCRYGPEAEIVALPIGPLPFSRLPALLLGLIPAQPRRGPAVDPEGAASFEDRYGREWRALIRGDRVEEWAVATLDGTAAAWRLVEGWAELSAPREETLLRWRVTTRERMLAAPSGLSAPPRYDEGACDLGWLQGAEDASWQ